MSPKQFKKLSRYIIISPVKDEEKYIDLVLNSMISQTLKPVMWIIVDDGSKDMTVDIVKKYSNAYPFIKLVKKQNEGPRQPGAGVIRTFNYGYEFIGDAEYDLIVKLDCDLSFDADYFESLIEKFNEDPKLGIASGVYFEQKKTGIWDEIKMPYYHAAGACKVMRKECFEMIAGFVIAAGWDTVDEIRAMCRGWKTRHFKDIVMKHHKIEGVGIGRIRTGVMHGEIYFKTGGSIIFFTLKLIQRLKSKPYVVGTVALAYGFLLAFIKRKARLVTKEESVYYKKLLHGRLIAQLKVFLARN